MATLTQLLTLGDVVEGVNFVRNATSTVATVTEEVTMITDGVASINEDDALSAAQTPVSVKQENVPPGNTTEQAYEALKEANEASKATCKRAFFAKVGLIGATILFPFAAPITVPAMVATSVAGHAAAVAAVTTGTALLVTDAQTK